MLMLVSVTPGSVAPVALPGPQTAFRVPKSPTPDAAAVVALPGADGRRGRRRLVDEPDRPHADATSTATMDTTTARLAVRRLAEHLPIPPLSPANRSGPRHLGDARDEGHSISIVRPGSQTRAPRPAPNPAARVPLPPTRNDGDIVVLVAGGTDLPCGHPEHESSFDQPGAAHFVAGSVRFHG